MNWAQYAVLSSILTAVMLVFSRYAIGSGADSITINTFRAAALLGFLFPMWIFSTGSIGVQRLYSSGALWYVLMGGVVGVFSWITYYEAIAVAYKTGLERTTESTAINETYLILVAVFDLIFFRKSFEWPVLVGTILVVIGVMVMTLKPEHWRALLRLAA